MAHTGASCPICGAPVESVRCSAGKCKYRCVLCLRLFDGPQAGKKGVEGAAKKAFANEITARKFMATPPEDEPRVETLVVPPGGEISLGGSISVSNPSDKEGMDIVFAGPITEAEEKRLNDAGIYPQASIHIATCDDCGKKITGDGPPHFGPITLDGIEEWAGIYDAEYGKERNK